MKIFENFCYDYLQTPIYNVYFIVVGGQENKQEQTGGKDHGNYKELYVVQQCFGIKNYRLYHCVSDCIGIMGQENKQGAKIMENLIIQLSDHGTCWICDIRFLVELSDGSGTHSVLVNTNQIYLDAHDWSSDKIREHIEAHVQAKLMLPDLNEFKYTLILPDELVR